MNVGIAATYVKFNDVDAQGLDLDDKHRCLAENKRAELTVDQLIDFIDQEHIELIGILQWLQVLGTYIPHLPSLKTWVSLLYRTHAARIPLPAKATPVHPLASSSKNETIITELKDALINFFDQLGQKEGDHFRRLLLVSGDGMTYKKLSTLKRYMQLHPDEFQSFETLEPVLAVWHTEWMLLSCAFETHWGSLYSPDPGTLGHSVAQIDCKTPKTLKKVDYYWGVELAYLVLDVRRLDCWQLLLKCDDIFEYFDQLASSGNLLQQEDLFDLAQQLHRSYSTTRGYYHAMDNVTEANTWSEVIPLGKPWVAPTIDESSLQGPEVNDSTQLPKKKSRRKAKESETLGVDFKGDRSLAKSIVLMQDMTFSQELSYAIAAGDVGRVYEVMKVILFNFAGSSHTNCTNYLLETVSNLELDSSPELKSIILKSTLINLTGREGAFSAGDFIQEYFNRLLDAMSERKGVDYGARFMRQVVSRNLHHFAQIKLDLRAGVGLAKRSQHHSAPHMNPEVKILLTTYRDLELHKHHSGRHYNDLEVDLDNFLQGIHHLGEGGKLAKWVASTTRVRGLLSKGNIEEISLDFEMGVEDEDREWEGQESDSVTLGMSEVIDGELVMMSVDIDGVEELMSHFDMELEGYE